jgi:hypothetical protein
MPCNNKNNNNKDNNNNNNSNNKVTIAERVYSDQTDATRCVSLTVNQAKSIGTAVVP